MVMALCLRQNTTLVYNVPPTSHIPVYCYTQKTICYLCVKIVPVVDSALAIAILLQMWPWRQLSQKKEIKDQLSTIQIFGNLKMNISENKDWHNVFQLSLLAIWVSVIIRVNNLILQQFDLSLKWRTDQMDVDVIY